MNPLDPRAPESYRSVAHYGEQEFIIEKSRFIGYTIPVATEEEARAFVAELHELHPQCTHVCYAYIIGQGGLNMRFSDDGEPSGTAGVPMLEVLKKEELTDIVVAVVRYFGGVKLGAGGLVRAYTKGVTAALETATITTWIKHRALTLSIDYTYQGTVGYNLDKQDWLLDDTIYDDKVRYKLFVPESGVDEARTLIDGWTSGRADQAWGDISYRGAKNG